MGFWSLLEVSSLPMLQVIIVCLLGAFMATNYLNLLKDETRKSVNKLVFAVFTPSLVFTSMADNVRFSDIISWWFMPVNIAITFVIGGGLGWIAVKIIRPKEYIQNIIVAMCAAGNLGNIMLIIIPGICNERGNPFGDKIVCRKMAFSYSSFSLALGAFYIWTFAYYLIKRAAEKYTAMLADEAEQKELGKETEANEKTPLLSEKVDVVVCSTSLTNDNAEQSHTLTAPAWQVLWGILHQIIHELKSPPIFASISGFTFGTVPWLRSLIIGDEAPLRVINDCIKLLGDGTIPCITLILGGSLTQGLRKAQVNVAMVMAVIAVRFILLPVIGIGVISAASHLGFLPDDPLFSFVLLIHYTVPPAMNISTMTQLFDVAQDECAVLFLWCYLVAAVAMTCWSTVFMWILS